MAIVKRKLAGGRHSYWVSFRVNGKQQWEHAGTNEREAKSLETQRKKEVADGTYVKAAHGRGVSFATFAATWLALRRTRNIKIERAQLETYVLTLDWLATTAMAELRPTHMVRLVRELKLATSETTGKHLSPKTVANIYGVVRTMIQDARIDEVVHVDPCVLKRGTLRRRTSKPRGIYELAEMRLLIASPEIELSSRVWNALSLLAGTREGETAGFRWSDWQRGPQPLSGLSVERQYDGRMLKTEEEEGEQPRRVPVHPELERILGWWEREGFPMVFLRSPRPGDPIVPHPRTGRPHTKSTAYKMWRRACVAAGVSNRSLHSTRHTFITTCRRHGAREEVLERVTHNARGSIVDMYTHWAWDPLCEAVLCLRLDDESPKSLPSPRGADVDATVDALAGSGRILEASEWRRRESKTGPQDHSRGILGHGGESDTPIGSLESPASQGVDAGVDASQHGGSHDGSDALPALEDGRVGLYWEDGKRVEVDVEKGELPSSIARRLAAAVNAKEDCPGLARVEGDRVRLIPVPNEPVAKRAGGGRS